MYKLANNIIINIAIQPHIGILFSNIIHASFQSFNFQKTFRGSVAKILTKELSDFSTLFEVKNKSCYIYIWILMVQSWYENYCIYHYL